jgi:hypothetical protein
MRSECGSGLVVMILRCWALFEDDERTEAQDGKMLYTRRRQWSTPFYS